MDEICKQKFCTGCSACVNVCPRNAIEMQEDEWGYIYPYIHASRCIDCKLCEKTCPVNHPVVLYAPLKAYAAISKDRHDLQTSTSGGVSSVLVDCILKSGGIVYGCIQTNYRQIGHQRITTQEAAFLMKGSKYVHSNIGQAFREVREDLQAGKTVLFTGTPCQIAGLRNYLRKCYEHLYTVDLVCHGVPAQKFLRDNVDYLLREHFPSCNPENIHVSFRGAEVEKSGKKYGISLRDKSKDTGPLWVRSFYEDYFTGGFLAEYLLRENCFECPYARASRTGDLTIADFWGLGKCSIPVDEGVSLVLINTEQGEKLYKEAASRLLKEERTVKEAINGNGRLKHPSTAPLNRSQFLSLYKTKGFIGASKVCLIPFYHQRRRMERKAFVLQQIKKIPLIDPSLKFLRKKLRSHD